MRSETRETLILAAVAAAVFVVLGFFSIGPEGIGWNYLVSVALIMAIYAIFAFGISLEFGQTGLLNFGHVATMLVSAYSTVLLFDRFVESGVPEALAGWSVAGFLVALFLSVLAALIVLVPATRLLSKAQVRPAKGLIALAGAGFVAVVVLTAIFPFGTTGATNATLALATLLALALAASLGLLLGLPAVRLREDYLAIVTIGAAEILRSIAVNEAWLTRGTLGIQRIHRPLVEWATTTPWWAELAHNLRLLPSLLAHALLAVALVAYLYLVLQILARSPWGRVLKAIRDDEDVAESLGKNVRFHKLQSLMIGSFIGGLGGILLAWHLSNVYPDHFPNLITFYGFMIVILGGIGNHKGTIAGAIVLWGVFEFAGNLTIFEQLGLRNVAGPPQMIAIGVLLILVMMFRPQGILGRRQEMLFAK